MEKEKKKPRGILSYFIGGKFLTSEIFTKNAWLFAMIVFYSFIYVSNRYAYQHQQSAIEKLKRNRQDLQYDVLTLQSEFSERSRQSHIEEYINKNNSQLKSATQPPFVIE